MGYLKSLLSTKRITHKHISWFSLWDSKTKFTRKTHIRSFAKLENVKIGEYSRIGLMCSVVNTTIGRFTVISRNCIINIAQHPTNYLSTHSIFYKKKSWGFHDDWIGDIKFKNREPVNIGNDVWVGINCFVKGGVTIGDGSIIGTGSIVTKDVPPYAIVGGVPAKVIRYRFSEEIRKRLLEIKWWELSDEEITNVLPVFHTNDITMETLNKYFPQ